MSQIILLNKPYGVLSQFTGEPGQKTLAALIPIPCVYAAGRLDHDSEGLLVLTDDGALQHSIADPKHKQPKVYFAQVEGIPSHRVLIALREGVDLGDFISRSCKAEEVEEPPWLWQRVPPIRSRKTVPTSWLKIELKEGRNRQVRRMTAKVGLPTLRLIRWSVAEWTIQGLELGSYRVILT